MDCSCTVTVACRVRVGISHLSVVDKDLFDTGLYGYLRSATGLHFYADDNEDYDEFMNIYINRKGITNIDNI